MLCSVGAAALWPHAAGAQPRVAADDVYVNGKIITVDGDFRVVSAFATKGDRILAVGDDRAVRSVADGATKIHDLKGRTVTPGFIDTHPHFSPRPDIQLSGLKSVADILQTIHAAALKAPPGAWIATSAIGEPPSYFHLPSSLAEKRWPTLAELDRAAPDNPVYVPTPSAWPYPALFNSRALALLGIDQNTPDDGRMRVEKDASGRLTGAIYGLDMYNQSNPFFAKVQAIAPPSPEAALRGVREGMAEYIQSGVTAVYPAHSVAPLLMRRQVEQIRASGQPLPRVVSAFQLPSRRPLADVARFLDSIPEARGEGSGDDNFRIVGFTVPMDGATQFGSALMSQPYLNPLGQLSNGESELSVEQLTEIGRLAAAKNFRLNVTLAGDRALESAMEAFEAVNRESPLQGRRWLVQHIQHPTQAQIARLKAMGFMVTTYSSVDYEKGALIYVDRFPGRETWKTVVPLRWWLDAGMAVGQGTDGRQKAPAFTMWESLVRVDGWTGRSLLTPAKTITRREALEMYTINGARIIEMGAKIGSIEPGKLADFVVLDRDILTVPVDDIRDMRVLATAMGGKVVYGTLP